MGGTHIHHVPPAAAHHNQLPVRPVHTPQIHQQQVMREAAAAPVPVHAREHPHREHNASSIAASYRRFYGQAGQAVESVSRQAGQAVESASEHMMRRTRINLAVCVVGALRTLLQPLVLDSLRSDIIEASGAHRADVFLALSETDRASLLLAQQELQPVWTLANVIEPSSGQLTHTALGKEPHSRVDWARVCVHVSPLMRQACKEVHGLNSVDGQPEAVAHGRLQFWWIARCLLGVDAYEQLAAVTYDFVVRTRPDVVFLRGLPSLRTLDATAAYHTLKASEPSDVLFVVPRSLRYDFLNATLRATQPGSGIHLWPEVTFALRLAPALDRSTGARAFNLRPLSVTSAIRRPCSLECLFPPTRAETLKPYAPELTAYELACHEAARRGRVFGLTHRVLTTIKAAPDQCTSAFALNGYRMACCASSLRQTCWQTARATRKSIGWPLDCGSADGNETRLPSDLNSTDANATHRQRRPHVAPRVLPSSSPTPTAQWVASWRES